MMFRYHPLLLAIALMVVTSSVHAHSDVDVVFEGDRIVVAFGPEGQVFESEFPTAGTFQQTTDDPGFIQEADTDPFPTGALIDYNILGPLMYHNGTAFAPVAHGVGIIIGDNPGGTITITDSTVGPISGPGVIGTAQGLHAHIDFELTNDHLDNAPPVGAYGLLMELIAVDDNLDPFPGIGKSDPFFIVFNFGMEHEAFEESLEAFAAVVPEPASIGLLAVGGMMLLRRQR